MQGDGTVGFDQCDPRGNPMLDLVFLVAVLAAFAAFAGLTHGCDRL
ncbi:MAG: hypothetical protein RLY86_1870 [Pseudomonadota bacterium]|jgi:hypothetical protein